MGDALVPEHLEGQLAEALTVAPVLGPVHQELVVDELVLEDAQLDFLWRMAVHPADLLGPGPVPAPQQGDAEADLRVPRAPGILLDDEQPRAAGHARRPDERRRRDVPARRAEDGLGLVAEGEGHATRWW